MPSGCGELKSKKVAKATITYMVPACPRMIRTLTIFRQVEAVQHATIEDFDAILVKRPLHNILFVIARRPEADEAIS